jgi:hypothetical protein
MCVSRHVCACVMLGAAMLPLQSTRHTLNRKAHTTRWTLPSKECTPASSKCFRLLGTHCRQARPPGPAMPFLLYQVSAWVPSTGNSCYAGIVLYPFSHSYLNFSEAEDYGGNQNHQTQRHSCPTPPSPHTPASSICFRLLGSHCRLAEPRNPGMFFPPYPVSPLVPFTGSPTARSCHPDVVSRNLPQHSAGGGAIQTIYKRKAAPLPTSPLAQTHPSSHAHRHTCLLQMFPSTWKPLPPSDASNPRKAFPAFQCLHGSLPLEALQLVADMLLYCI